MKKLNVLLVLALCLTLLLPFSAAADEPTYAADTVAVIGTTEYSDLQKAFDAVKTGETIRLVADIADTKKTATYSGTVYEKGNAVSRGRVTLDGNGHSLTYSGGSSDANFALVFDANAVIEVKALTVFSYRSGVKLTDGAQVFLKDCNICAAKTDYRSATHDLTANKDFKGLAVKIDNDWRSYVEIDGGHYRGAFSTMIDIRYGSITVKDGDFKVYNSTVLLQVGDSIGESAADTARAAGYLLGGTFESIDSKANGAMIARAYKSATLSIWGGDYFQRSEGTKSGGSTVIAAGTSSSYGYTHIYGGSFYQFSSSPASKLVGNNQLTGNSGVPEAKDKAFFYISGGTFWSKKVDNRDESDMLRENGVLRYGEEVASIVKTTDTYGIDEMNKYTVTYRYNETAPMPNAVAKIVNTDGGVYYADSLWAALNTFAKDGATVTLLADVSLEHTLTLNNRYATLTLDGNGKTLTSTAAVAVNVQSGSITIKSLTLNAAEKTAFHVGYLCAANEVVSGASYTADLTLSDLTVTAKTLLVADEMSVLSGQAKLERVALNGEAAVTKTHALPLSEETDEPSDQPTDTDTDTAESEQPTQAPTEEQTTAATPTATEEDTAASGSNADGCASSIGALPVLALAATACAGLLCKRRKEN